MCWIYDCDDCKDGKGFQIQYGEMSYEVSAKSCSWFIRKNDISFKSSRSWLLRSTGGLYHQYSSPVSTTVLPRGNKHHIINISVKLLVLTLLPVDCTCQAQDEIQSAHWKQSQVSLLSATFLVFRNNAFTCDSI